MHLQRKDEIVSTTIGTEENKLSLKIRERTPAESLLPGTSQKGGLVAAFPGTPVIRLLGQLLASTSLELGLFLPPPATPALPVGIAPLVIRNH